MKIAVISPNATHLREISAALEKASHQATSYEGGKTRMPEIAERDHPDLMLVDGICCDAEELTYVEYVTSHYPATAVILLCSTQTPDFLIQAMRAGVREVLPSPAPADALEAAVHRISAKMTRAAPSKRGQVLAFMSTKGGNGATFLATNLGWHLAETSSVLLIDLNLQFGDALSFLHDGQPPATLADVARDITRLDAALLSASTVRVSQNFQVLAAPDDLAQAVEITGDQVEAILDQAMSQYQYVLVDLPRSLDMRSVRVLDRATRIYLVMQASLPDVRHAGRLLGGFRTLGYPADRTEIIVNRRDRSSEIALEQIQRSVGSTRVRSVANAWRDVSASINHGEPVAKGGHGNAVVRQLKELAQEFSPRLQEEGRGFFDRLRRRA
jgi:pilus assembly protein CpaE